MALIYHLKISKKQMYKLSKDVLLRYEESIDSGTFFIFNVVNKELWCGNKTSKVLVELIDGINCTKNIKSKLSSILQTDLSPELCGSIDNILNELLEKGMIVLV